MPKELIIKCPTYYSGGAKGQIWPNRDKIKRQASVVPLEAQFNVVYHTKRPNYHDVGNFFGTGLSETGFSKI